jgi:hypothetical protein
MLKKIRISELQFHLRDENCKVYPVTINELPFYLCLKHTDREIYDVYFEHTKRVCPSDFSGVNQDYDYFNSIRLSVEQSGWHDDSYITLWKNPKGKWGKMKSEHKASDGNLYLVEDGMHRVSLLFYLYGDIDLVEVSKRRRNHRCYIPKLNEGL